MMIRLTKEDELNTILNLYNKCKIKLIENGILQWGTWGNGYPNMEFIIETYDRNELFVYAINNHIIGAVVLNNEQDDEWNTIHWNSSIDKTLIIHAMAIDPDFQGNGYGRKLLEYCEQQAQNNGAEYVRLDALENNIVSCNLYISNNYKVVGNFICDCKPEGYKVYKCFEKSIKINL